MTEEQKDVVIEEIYNILCKHGGLILFLEHKDHIDVQVKDYYDEVARSFNITMLYIDNDNDVMLFGREDFTKATWGTEFIYDVVGDGILRIADTLRRITEQD